MKDAQVKLHCTISSGDRDLFRRGRTKYNNIFSNAMVSKKDNEAILAGMVARIVLFEHNKMVYILFEKIRFRCIEQNKYLIPYPS